MGARGGEEEEEEEEEEEMEEYEEEDKGMTSPLQSPDIIALVFARLSAPEDLLSASAVCRCQIHSLCNEFIDELNLNLILSLKA